MSDSVVKLHLWLIRETDMARQFSTTPQQERDGKKVWIPRSQIERVFKFGVPPGWKEGDWRECEVVLQSWIAEREGLA